MSNDLTQTAGGSKRKREPAPAAIQWIPWEKILIWSLFLALVFVMRHFFLIIFLTFITSYIMRNIVVRIAGMISSRPNIWLERGITVVCFLLLLFGLYETGAFFGPKLIAQAQALAGRATQMDPKRELENALGRAVGPWLFRKNYGDRGDVRYQKEFEKFRAEGSPRFVDYQDFDVLRTSIDGALDLDIENTERQTLQAALAQKGGMPGAEFDDWFLKNHAATIVARNRESAIARWEGREQNARGHDGFEQLKKSANYEIRREEGMKRDALEATRRDKKSLSEFIDEWKNQTIAHRVADFKGTPAYAERLKIYYEQRRLQSPAGVKFEFDKYQRLKKAFELGEAAFTAELAKIDAGNEEQNAEQAHRDFVAKEQVSLAMQWWQADQTALAIKSAVGKSINEMAVVATSNVRDAIRYTITLPVQIGLSLLLSFFITIDIPTMKKGLNRLKTSRAAGLYEEIAPGLSSFSWLMGRAFQAQALIALCNTILTFFALRWIGIDNEVFLCAIVFICSFIPVVGVVLSSAPIAVMAVIQPQGGSIWLALMAIGAILVIHFIETSVFNPKILGEMLHLHPVLVLTILAVGEHFFGVWGLLLGTPVAVYIIRFIILDEGIPGVIEPVRRPAPPPQLT